MTLESGPKNVLVALCVPWDFLPPKTWTLELSRVASCSSVGRMCSVALRSCLQTLEETLQASQESKGQERVYPIPPQRSITFILLSQLNLCSCFFQNKVLIHMFPIIPMKCLCMTQTLVVCGMTSFQYISNWFLEVTFVFCTFELNYS